MGTGSGVVQPWGKSVDLLNCVEASVEAKMPPVLLLWFSPSSTRSQEGQKSNRVHLKLECFWFIEGIEGKDTDNIIKSGQNGSGLIRGRNWRPEEQDGLEESQAKDLGLDGTQEFVCGHKWGWELRDGPVAVRQRVKCWIPQCSDARDSTVLLNTAKDGSGSGKTDRKLRGNKKTLAAHRI